ncbi:MAG: WD40 repeat domain-containing protein [Candidatus Sigynarchaeota archaeon]
MRGPTKACLGDYIPRIDVQIEALLPRQNLNGGNRTFCMALSHDEARVFTGREDGWLFSWPLASGTGIKKTRVDASIERILVTNDGNLVILAGDGSITILDSVDLHGIAHRDGAHSRGIFAGAFDARDRVLVTGGLDGWIRSWRFPSLDLIASNKSPKHGVLSLAILPDDDKPLLVTGNVNGSIASFDLDTLALKETFKGHDGPVFSMKALSSNCGISIGDILYISAGGDGVVAAWKDGATEPLFVIRSAQAKLLDVLPVARQGDGVMIWTASADGSIGAWLLAPFGSTCTRAEQLACFQSHDRAAEQLVACAGGQQLLSIASDGSLLRLRT